MEKTNEMNTVTPPREVYEKASVEIIAFDNTKDIICTSGEFYGLFDPLDDF